jgi:hypothetical protein
MDNNELEALKLHVADFMTAGAASPRPLLEPYNLLRRECDPLETEIASMETSLTNPALSDIERQIGEIEILERRRLLEPMKALRDSIAEYIHDVRIAGKQDLKKDRVAVEYSNRQKALHDEASIREAVRKLALRIANGLSELASAPTRIKYRKVQEAVARLGSAEDEGVKEAIAGEILQSVDPVLNVKVCSHPDVKARLARFFATELENAIS